MEEHAVSDAGLDVLRPGVTRVFSEQTPAASLTVICVKPTELRFRRPAVIHTAITCQNPTTKSVNHVFLRVHAHLRERERQTVCPNTLRDTELFIINLYKGDSWWYEGIYPYKMRTWWSNTSLGPPSADVSSLRRVHVLASMS